MTEVLDRFGEQLRAAQVTAVDSPEKQSRTRLRHVLRRHRLAAGVVTALAVAAPAAAIVAPWEPSLYRPGLDEPVATSQAPVSDDASDWLAVLRRPQTQQDRDNSAPALRTVGAGDLADGIQTADIRALSDGWALVPATSVRSGDGTTAAGLCLANAAQLACGQNQMIERIGMGGSQASARATEFFGLVPDGVAKVRFTPLNGEPTLVNVTSNFYDLTISGSSTGGKVTPPPGYQGPKITPPPMPVAGTVAWLDSSGSVVGPTQR